MPCGVLLVFLLVFLAPAVQVEDAEAKKLYQAMVDKITAAKTLKVVVEMQGTPFGETKTAAPKFKQTIWIAQGNKVRWTFEQPVKDKVDKEGLVVCDGKELSYRSSVATLKRAAAEQFSGKLTEALAKYGCWVGIAVLNDALDPDGKPYEGMVTSTFRMGKKEKLDGKEAQTFQYALRDKGGPVGEVAVCTVWLDPKTQLPLKMLLEGGNSFRVQETYVEWQLDPKLDAKLFSAPK
jgi:outer membrane lipoprotein-sorting protein